MELKLIVLAGAKQGLEIPLKKDKFLIGRAKECSLRAGSEAISRRHCAIVRKDDRYTVRDLGSRNGTYVNDVRIAEEVNLSAGDELRVGPLVFNVAARGEKKAAPQAESAAPSTAPAPTKPKKQPPVKDMADIIQRTVNKSDDNTSEDDVSRWLLGLPEGNGEGNNLKETLAIRMEDTQAHGRMSANNGTISADDIQAPSEAADVDDEAAEDAIGESESKSGWGLFKRGKGGTSKKQPGKLPPRPEQQSKDSREAAADILREMTRRR
jgi:predicted component of type VI protein secretion system